MGIHTQPSSGARMMFKCSTTLTVLCFLWASMTSIECRRGPSRGTLKRIETKIDSFLSTSKIVTIDNQLQLTASGFFTLESCTDFTESPYSFQALKQDTFGMRLGPNEPAACSVTEIVASDTNGGCIPFKKDQKQIWSFQIQVCPGAKGCSADTTASCIILPM